MLRLEPVPVAAAGAVPACVRLRTDGEAKQQQHGVIGIIVMQKLPADQFGLRRIAGVDPVQRGLQSIGPLQHTAPPVPEAECGAA